MQRAQNTTGFFCHVNSFFEISNGVVVLAGVEFIFIVAGMGLYFGFGKDNTGMFWLFEQGLPRIKAFCAPHPIPPERRLGVHKELGEDTVGTAVPH